VRKCYMRTPGVRMYPHQVVLTGSSRHSVVSSKGPGTRGVHRQLTRRSNGQISASDSR
jgi:hypothetical protein